MNGSLFAPLIAFEPIKFAFFDDIFPHLETTLY